MKKKLRIIASTSVFRMMFLIIIAILPVNILTIFLGNEVVDGAENQVSEETQNALELYMNQIDGAMKRIVLKMGLIARDNIEFRRLNVKEITDQTEWYDQLQSVVTMQNDFADILKDNEWITGVYAYFPEKDFMVASNRYARHDEDVLNYINSLTVNMTDEFSKRWEIIRDENGQSIVLIDSYKNAYYGAWLDLNEVSERLEIDKKRPESGSMMFIADSSGKGICPTWAEDIEVLYETKYQKIDGDLWTMQYVMSKSSDLVLVNLISKNEMSRSLPQLIHILQFFSIASLAILPIIIVAMRRWMIQPLSKLSSAMKKIEKGEVDFRISDAKTGSEFVQINRNFNHMMDEVTSLRIDVYEKKLLVQDIKLRFLSQQIQPHFILNSMNIIYSYEPEEYDLIQKMVLCLSKYFRYVVNANMDFVLLHQEMTHIKNYFDIQQARYPKTFFAMVEYEDELKNCYIPPLLIQNFAENAIKHSLKIGNKIDIFIISQKVGDKMFRIRLLDTGEGIPEAVLDKVEAFKKTGEYQEGLGIGIQNAIERLNVIYGQDAEIKISQVEPCGTQVEILLPLRYPEGEVDDEDDIN